MKKLLCLALAIVMCLGLLPTAASATEQVITEIELSGYTPPVLGEQPDYNLSVPQDAPYHLATVEEMRVADFAPYGARNGVWWNEGNRIMSYTETFQNAAAGAYYMDLLLIANQGYQFGKKPTITINGDSALVDVVASQGSALYLGTQNLTAVPLKLIDQVTISGFAKPVYGEAPDYDFSLPEGAPFHFATKEELKAAGYHPNLAETSNNGIWWSGNDEIMLPGSTFTSLEKNAYFAHMILMPNQGYAFAEDVDVSVDGGVRLRNIRSVGTELSFETQAFTVIEPAPEYRIHLEFTGPGRVTASCETAAEGTEVTFTVTPDADGRLKQITAVDSQNHPVRAKKEGSTYTFAMPASDVTIHAVFEADNPGFKDVAPGQWYYDHVNWAVANGITQGFPDGTFQPQASCTRAEMVTFLWRVAGTPEPESDENPFSDVSASDWYAQAVLWAVEAGVTEGFPDGTFQPKASCTRAQVVTFLHRADGGGKPTAQDNPFRDVKSDSWYTQAVLWAVANEITEGFPDGTFQPKAECTRAQIVTFLHRAMEI